MKKAKHMLHHHTGVGLILAAFGVFFLIANLVPETTKMLRFWPIFLIAFGLQKAFCCDSCKTKK